jgi:hypothetical protein
VGRNTLSKPKRKKNLGFYIKKFELLKKKRRWFMKRKGVGVGWKWEIQRVKREQENKTSGKITKLNFSGN